MEFCWWKLPVSFFFFVLRQLQKINDVIELILVTEEINIEEIG